MFAKSHVFLSALAVAAAFAFSPAVQADETPDIRAAIRAQILGVSKGPPVTGAMVPEETYLEPRERARRALLGLPSPKVAVPLVAQPSEPIDVRELARRQILGQPTAASAAPAEVVAAR